MACKIRVLDDLTINKIAAGEVVQDSSSIVKELIENSLDAEATEIFLEISGDGRKLIRIQDNGRGMSRDEALLCFERHATSKIQNVEDLDDLSTMGFRGEALASIAAVSKVSLLTCPRNEREHDNSKCEGTSVVIEGGKIISCQATTTFPGTQLEVSSLFYNVPARRKFQKAPQKEKQEILKTVCALALAFPEVTFSCIVHGGEKWLFSKKEMHCYGERVQDVLGPQIFSKMLFLDCMIDGVRIFGYIGSPEQARTNRTGQQLFINRRVVLSPIISHAVKEGYGASIEKGVFPIFVLHIALAQGELDVNVHPQKKEVRFLREEKIHEVLVGAIEKTLFRTTGPKIKQNFCTVLNPQEAPTVQAEKQQISYVLPRNHLDVEIKANAEYKRIEEIELPLKFTSSTSLPFKVLAIFHEFLLLQCCTKGAFPESVPLQISEDILLICNLKKAILRLEYDRMLEEDGKTGVISQGLVVPHFLELTIEEAFCLQRCLPQLKEMGFQFRNFSKTSFLVEAIPRGVEGQDIDSCIREFLGHSMDDISSHGNSALKKRLFARSASRKCAHMQYPLSNDDASRLLERLLASQDAMYCPFGGPIFVALERKELQEKFEMRVNR